MAGRTLFLEWQAFDEQSLSPPFNKPIQGVILDYGAPPGVDDATLVETDRGAQMVPVGADLFAAFARTLPDLAVIDVKSYEGLVRSVEKLTGRQPDRIPAARALETSKMRCSGKSRPPGPTPGH